MGEKKTKKILTKETIISAIIGLVVGIGITCLAGFLMDYFATSAGMAKLLHGDETIATVDGKALKSGEFYNVAKKNGLNFMMNEIDNIILNDMYELTEKDVKTAKEEADYYIE